MSDPTQLLNAVNECHRLREKIQKLEAENNEMKQKFKEFSEFSPHCCEDCPCDYFRAESSKILKSDGK